MQSSPSTPITRAGERVWGRVDPRAGTTRTAPGVPPGRADVVVVGGGITGLTTALLLRRAGTDVVLLEAREPGAGTTGGTTGKVSLLQGRHVQEIRSRHGDATTAAYLAQHLAAQRFVAQQVGDQPDVAQRRTAVTYTTSPSGRSTLESEVAALACGGIVPTWRDELPDVPLGAKGAIELADQLQIQPARYLEHLLAELQSPPAPGEGTCDVVTGWRVRDVGGVVGSADGTGVDTAAGADGLHEPVLVTAVRGGQEVTVRADRVVIATLLPFLDRGLLFARSEPTRSWCLAARLAGPAPTGMYLGIDSPTRSLRSGTSEDELVVGGNSHVTGRGGSTSERLADLDRWTRSRFDVVEVRTGWAAQDYATADRLPWVGPLVPTHERVLVASGFAKWGMTGGTAAAMQLAAVVLGASSAWPWHPWRPSAVAQATGSAKINAGVAARLATGWGGALTRSASSAPPAEGQARVERRGRRLCGISTVDGVTRERSAVCTHLGGVVSWNDAERSWDCPLHGSRFGADGEVLDGPAVDPLAETPQAERPPAG